MSCPLVMHPPSGSDQAQATNDHLHGAGHSQINTPIAATLASRHSVKAGQKGRWAHGHIIAAKKGRRMNLADKLVQPTSRRWIACAAEGEYRSGVPTSS